MTRGLLPTALALAAMVFGIAGSSAAEEYPQKPIQLYVPVGPGGFSDTLARIVAQEVSKGLGQQMVVINEPAGGGIQLAQKIAHADPDGYALMMAIPGTHVMNIGLRENLPYDPETDFDPISLLAQVSNVLIASPSAPFATVQEFIDYAGQHPDELFYGSTGVGSTHHLAMELLKDRTGIKVTHVPYASSPDSLAAILRNDVQVMFDNLVFQAPHIKGGETKALGVASPERHPLLPDVPTISEAGLANFVAETWWGIVAPAGTPAEIREELAKAFQKAVKSPVVAERLPGAKLIGTSPDEFSDYLQKERATWVPMIKRAGIHLE